MSTIKSKRRTPRQTEQSISGIVDLGGMMTPPLFPPLAYHPESDMRSTRNDFLPPHRVEGGSQAHAGSGKDSGDTISSDEDVLDHARHEQQSLIYPTWTPINNPYERPRKLPLDLAAFSLRNGYTLTNAELRMNEIFDQDFENVDKKDGLVYHKGHKSQDHDGQGTSYSFVWLEDDPEVLPAHVQQWKDKKTKDQRSLEGPTLENNVRCMLETGSAMILERTDSRSSSTDVNECLLPDCRHSRESLTADHFYLTLRPGRQPWQLPEPFQFCLACFERLWMGNFSQSPGPPGITVRRDIDTESQNRESKMYELRSDSLFDLNPNTYDNQLALDGTMNSLTVDDALRVPSLCSSRHAPPDMASSPLHQVISELETAANDSPSSINSRGEWTVPPNRVQHLAAFIKPGKSLTPRETAAVNLWKAASFEQLQWDAHQQKTRYRREYEEGEALVDRSLNMTEYQIEDVDGDEIDEAVAEAIVKLPKSRFRGCSLADVWLVMKNEAA